MRSDLLNKNSGQYLDSATFDSLGGTKKVMSFGGSCEEALLDSATTAYADNDIIKYGGELDVSVPAGHNAPLKILIERINFCCDVATGTTMVGNIGVGTAASEALNGAATGYVELFGAGVTYRNQELAANLSITEVDVDFNAAGIMYAPPYIIVPVATRYVYVCTATAINHATNFDAGRYNVQIEYTVL